MQNQFENESKRHAYEIKGVRNKIYNLKKELEETIEKLNELKRICPHTETREEYDDDFHKCAQNRPFEQLEHCVQWDIAMEYPVVDWVKFECCIRSTCSERMDRWQTLVPPFVLFPFPLAF